MADAVIEVNDEIPEVSPTDTLKWMDSQILRAKAAVAKKWAQAEGVRDGSLPPGVFDPKEFLTLKRALGLFETARTALIGLVGSAAGHPAEDIDEQFFGILSETYGYDVTKPYPTKESA